MALANNKPLKTYEGEKFYELPGSNVEFFEGGAGFMDANGHVVKDNSSGTLQFVGHVAAYADKSGVTAGAEDIQLRGPLPYIGEVVVAGITALSDLGSAVYMSDDGTYTLTATSATQVGKIVKVVNVSNTIALVEFSPFIAAS